MELKFFKCDLCGKILTLVKETGVPTVCCGQTMTEIVAGSVDAAVEKHVPVVSVDGTKISVSVGEVTHPMLEEHYIEWITISTKKGSQTKVLSPADQPVAEFLITEEDEFVSAYAYCNLHGLWKSK